MSQTRADIGAKMQGMAKAKESPGEKRPSDAPVRANAREERMRRNLEQFIKDSGYSTTEVADMAGIPQANLGRYTRGDSSIPGDALEPLARVLGRESVDDFYATDPPKQRTRDELEVMQPIFAKSRPGFEPTEEDLRDFEEYLAKVRSRRDKKKPKR